VCWIAGLGFIVACASLVSRWVSWQRRTMTSGSLLYLYRGMQGSTVIINADKVKYGKKYSHTRRRWSQQLVQLSGASGPGIQTQFPNIVPIYGISGLSSNLRITEKQLGCWRLYYRFRKCYPFCNILQTHRYQVIDFLTWIYSNRLFYRYRYCGVHAAAHTAYARQSAIISEKEINYLFHSAHASYNYFKNMVQKSVRLGTLKHA
jgi:hypothetical protein